MKFSKRHLLNYSVLIPYLILAVLGLVVVYSTTSANAIVKELNVYSDTIKHFAFWILSLVLIFVFYRMKLSFLRKKSVVYLVILFEIGLLLWARLFSAPVNGAYGWINLFGITIQPAEYLKLIIIWFLALKFSDIQLSIAEYDYQALNTRFYLPKKLFDWRFMSLILMGLVVIMPDLGNAVIIFLIIVIMVAVSGIAPKWLQVLLGIITILSTFFLGLIGIVGPKVMSRIPVFGYVARRFTAFYNPFEDLTDAGHQLANSYYAISNGGWFGLGLGNSIQKNGYLREAHTDFAFSIVFEELGLVGASLVLALLFFLILRIFVVGIRARDPFNAMIALGVGGMILIQTFVNIGGISGLIPATGVTFPFLSQGGNSLLTISIGIAFVLNIDASEKRQLMIEEIEQTIV